MLHNYLLNPVLRNIFGNTKILVRYSALFINGLKASDTYVFVTPHVDITEIFQNKEKIKSEIKRRSSKYDFTKLENVWSVYTELEERFKILENKKSELASDLMKLTKSNSDSDKLNHLKIKINLIKDNIKALKSPLWSAEETAILEVLKLPNNLHPLTPDNEESILYSYSNPPSSKQNHLALGNNLDIIQFKKKENYYLKGDSAIFELGAKFYFSKALRAKKFVQFSNTDFVKSVVIEGCGEDHTNPDKTFILHHNEDGKVNVDNRLHLTGGASLYSFFAYHAKNVVHAKALPLKYFSIGRQYNPSPTDEDNLFNVSQSSVVQLFSATVDNSQLQDVFNEVVTIFKELYTGLGYHFRLRLIPADKLCLWESLRVSVEMFSTSLDQYVEIANLSISNDFISKRLMFTYVEDKRNKFPYILSGTVLNVPKLLACVLEQDDNFVIPKMFHVDNWSI